MEGEGKGGSWGPWVRQREGFAFKKGAKGPCFCFGALSFALGPFLLPWGPVFCFKALPSALNYFPSMFAKEGNLR
jgi:hypothetical protein